MSKSPKDSIRHIAKYLTTFAESDKQTKKVSYMARAMVMATLPHSKSNDLIFQRKNGNYTLTITANPEFGLPYGSIPRMLFAWITTVTVNQKNPSPEIDLGKSFNSFLKKLRLQNGGGERGSSTRVRDQMMRLLSCTISSVYHDQKKGICQSDQFLISRSFQLWWNPLQPGHKRFLPSSKITLAKDFFEELIRSPVPIDFESLNLLRRSPLQIDIYIWLTYRFSFLKKETLIPWGLLKQQFGSDYAEDSEGTRNFKKKFLLALKKVWLVYPAANVFPSEKGLTLYPSDTHVKKRSKKANNPVDN
ncbi:MAG: replication protein RepA [Gammaproteobacteria bacterium]